MTIARPYPETVEALEECIRQRDYEIEASRLRIQGLQQTIEHQARQDGERIAALEAEVERHRTLARGLTPARAADAWVTATGQQTRAEEAIAREPYYYTDEEIALHRQQKREGNAKAKEALARARTRAETESNEERD